MNAQQLGIEGDFAMTFSEGWMKGLIEQTIPIYTIKHPNPKSGREDCRMTTREKEHFRILMKAKLSAAKSDEQRQKIIDHYKELFSGESK